MAKRIKNTSDLRGMLLDVMQDVRSEKISASAAKSISALTGRLLESVRLDLQVMKQDVDMQKKVPFVAPQIEG